MARRDWCGKRLFGDRDVYNVFYECTSLQHGLDSLSKTQKTIAQARLMDWIPKVAVLNWNAISCSHLKEIEDKYKVKGGLLDYAVLSMVDFKDDVLMHRCLIDFFSELLKATAKLDTHTMPQHDSVGLQYMIMHGLHARTAAIYFQTGHADPVDAMFLYGPAANYISVYATEYPKHYLAGQMPKQVNERLLATLDLSPGKWAHADSPKHDLHVLASLPRAALLPFASSPVALLPSKSTNPDVLDTLATVFHGPQRQALTFPANSSATAYSNRDQDAEEGAAARALYFHYVANNQRLWQDVTNHADTVALVCTIIKSSYSQLLTPVTDGPGTLSNQPPHLSNHGQLVHHPLPPSPVLLNRHPRQRPPSHPQPARAGVHSPLPPEAGQDVREPGRRGAATRRARRTRSRRRSSRR